MESFRGKLLLATPELIDPNFHRSVVLIIEHTNDGAIGVVLNRRTELNSTEVLPMGFSSAQIRFYFGVVQYNKIHCLL